MAPTVSPRAATADIARRLFGFSAPTTAITISAGKIPKQAKNTPQ